MLENPEKSESSSREELERGSEELERGSEEWERVIVEWDMEEGERGRFRLFRIF